MLIASRRVNLAQRDISFLVCAEGRTLPLDERVRAGGGHVQLVGSDAEGRGIAKPVVPNCTIGTIEVVAHNCSGESAGGCR